MFLGEVTEPSVAMVIIVSHQGRKRNAAGKKDQISCFDFDKVNRRSDGLIKKVPRIVGM